MKQMVHRTTFALDTETASRLQRLALVWQVSQAEVVRRAVALAEASAIGETNDPAAGLRALHRQGGGMAREAAVAYLASVDQDRGVWRDEG